VIVSRDFIADNEEISTVICAPVYRASIGLRSEALVGADDGFPQESSIRCDFITLMMKSKLTHFVGTLSAEKQRELSRALADALQLSN
jgi:mRNA-degrading endonuclease toxin of MazEF toxin-antitoxin module